MLERFCTCDLKITRVERLPQTFHKVALYAIASAALAISLLFVIRWNQLGPSSDMSTITGIYYSNWSVYGPKHFPSDLDVDNLTHIFYAFLKIDPDKGTVLFSDPWADTEMPVDGVPGAVAALMKLKTKKANLKVAASIGGWGTAAMFQLVTSNSGKQAEFVRSALDLASRHGFDGLDIDWEYPSTLAEGQKLAELLKELRHGMNKMGRPELSLSVASPANPGFLANYPLHQLDRYVSFWNVMGYDFFGAGWSPVTGHHSNLLGDSRQHEPSASLAVQYYLKGGIPPEKLVLGMPLYARTFYKPDAPQIGVPFEKNSPYDSDIIDYVDVPHEREQYDRTRVAAFQFDPETLLFYTYDSVQCAREKARFVRRHRLRGGFWWDSKGESRDRERQLVRAFSAELATA